MNAGQTKQSLTVALGARRYRVDRPWGRWPGGLRSGLISDVAIDSADNVYVLQRFDTLAGAVGAPVVVFDRDGNHLRHWGEGVIADGHMLALLPTTGRSWLIAMPTRCWLSTREESCCSASASGTGRTGPSTIRPTLPLRRMATSMSPTATAPRWSIALPPTAR